MFRFIWVTLLTLLLFSCSIKKSKKDELCGFMDKVEDAVQVNSPIKIRFNFSSGFMGRQCHFYDSQVASEFCEYFIHNSSGEFMNSNISSVLSCMGSDVSLGSLRLKNFEGDFYQSNTQRHPDTHSINLKAGIYDDYRLNFLELIFSNHGE